MANLQKEDLLLQLLFPIEIPYTFVIDTCKTRKVNNPLQLY